MPLCVTRFDNFSAWQEREGKRKGRGRKNPGEERRGEEKKKREEERRERGEWEK